MVLVWLSSSFCYYMISYQLKYLEGSIWINSIVSSSSEIVAYLTSGILFKYVGFQYTLYLSYVVSIVGMACLTAWPDSSQVLLGLYILGSKYGVSQIFNMAYVGNQYLFPIALVATSFSIGNFFARIATIFAPYIAELKPDSISKWVFIAVCSVAFVGSLFI